MKILRNLFAKHTNFLQFFCDILGKFWPPEQKKKKKKKPNKKKKKKTLTDPFLTSACKRGCFFFLVA